MNKIIIITDFRPPKKGEKYIFMYDAQTAEYDFSKDVSHYIVGAELEVPENAACFAYHFRTSNREIPNEHGAIPLPRKTVKKWIWEWKTGNYGVRTITPMSLEEMERHNNFQAMIGWRKVDGSEIEVEE